MVPDMVEVPRWVLLKQFFRVFLNLLILLLITTTANAFIEDCFLPWGYLTLVEGASWLKASAPACEPPEYRRPPPPPPIFRVCPVLCISYAVYQLALPYKYTYEVYISFCCGSPASMLTLRLQIYKDV